MQLKSVKILTTIELQTSCFNLLNAVMPNVIMIYVAAPEKVDKRTSLSHQGMDYHGKVSVGQIFEFLKSTEVTGAMLKSFFRLALLAMGGSMSLLKWLDGAR
jgi:hypothetical protein